MSTNTNTNTTIRYDKAVKYYQLVRFMANLFSKDDSTKVGALFIAPNNREQGDVRGTGKKRRPIYLRACIIFMLIF